MTRVRGRPPSSSFDPALLDILRAGCGGVVRLPCGTRGEATHIRQRLHTFREVLKYENANPEWKALYSVAVRLEPGNPSVLLIGPKDRRVKDLARAAGIPLTEDLPADFEPLNGGLNTKKATLDLETKFLDDLDNLK